MKEQVFKFTVSVPQVQNFDGSALQFMTITMSAPTCTFPVNLKSTTDPEVQRRLGAAELKIKMIEALLAGEWEYK